MPPLPTPHNRIMLISRLTCFAAILLSLCLSIPAAHANGCYIPQQAYPAMPTIPVQRAIIVHRDGQETLIVESGVQSPSPTVGWILPLPTEPTRLEKADPGMLISASMSLRPWLIHDLQQPAEGILFLFAFCAAPLAALALVREPKRRRERMKLAATVSIMVLLIISTLLPSLGSSGRSDAIGSSGVTLLNAQQVGNYDVSVLKARSGDDLSQWLTNHGLRALPDAARPVVDSYIKDNWCFLVSVLRLSGPEPAMPHPIMATFPATAPVFPMRLTAIAGSTTRVDLTVISNTRAEADRFHLVCCDKFVKSFQDTAWYRTSTWNGTSHRLVIGSPAVTSLLWPDCVVSHLVSDLPPAEMTTDISLRSVPFQPYRDSFWTSRGRNELALTILTGGGVILLTALAFACRGRKLPSRRGRISLNAIAAATAISILGAYLLIPVVGVQMSAHAGMVWTFDQETEMGDLIKANADQLAAAGDDLPQRLMALVHASPVIAQNDLLGGPRRWERSPGNLGLSNMPDHHDIVMYDANCEEQYIAPLPTTQPAP